MKKVFLIILVLIFCTAGDCEIERELKTKNISEEEEISKDDETCSTSWLDSPAAFMLTSMERMFASRSENMTEPTFLHFSRRNTQEPGYVTNANLTSWSTNGDAFDPKIKTVFIINGFKDSHAPWTRKLKEALILREDCNVFIVEYGHLSETYSEALKNSPGVGKQVATFIRNLMKSTHLDLQRVHVIGHSVGAHIAGFAGNEIRKKEKRALGRITGLDPAGPGFYDASPDQRLDATDASFVDIIHTNWGCNRLEGFGFSDASGHFDFYPNGGQLQPGCQTTSQFLGKMNFSVTKSAFKYLFGKLEQVEKKVLDSMLCSHISSYQLFTASILKDDCKLRSVQCSSWKRFASGQCSSNDEVPMGYYADEYKDKTEKAVHKKFYLETTLLNCN